MLSPESFQLTFFFQQYKVKVSHRGLVTLVVLYINAITNAYCRFNVIIPVAVLKIDRHEVKKKLIVNTLIGQVHECLVLGTGKLMSDISTCMLFLRLYA